MRSPARTPRQVCKFAPPRSASIRMTRRPERAATVARFATRKLLPMPPLPPPTAQMRATLGGVATTSSPRPGRPGSPRLVLSQLGVPVRRIQDRQEWTPFGVSLSWGDHAYDRRPSRTLRRTEESHPRLARRSTSLVPIALDAAADHVLPSRSPPLRARDHVVEVQLRTCLAPATILTRIAVARVDVRAREAHVSARNTIEERELKDSRNADAPADRPDGRVVAAHRLPSPGVELEGVVLLVDRLREPLVQQDEGAAHRR